MMDEEIRQAVSEVREMKQMCGNINMKLTNIVTQRGQNWKEKLEAEYQRGLDDAWEAARKIVEMADTPYWGVFNEYKNDLFGKISASEAIEKLKAYEEKKLDDEIKVGDEVTHKLDSITWTAVVTQNDNGMLTLMDRTGAIADDYDEKCYVKTGRHFDIASILEDMRND